MIDVSKAPVGQHLLHVEVEYGQVKIGDEVVAKVEENKRELTRRNHSATHLLHAAIGNVLGEHVDQKGSFVNEDYLRFDFTSLRALTEEEKRKIEDEVNQKISEGIPQITKILPIEEAKSLGAEMEFSEKYGDVVRVVTFGEYSKEFCGGTHVSNSRDIGLFVIESEEAISSGTRRIQGRTSIGAYRYLDNKRRLLANVESIFPGSSDKDILQKEQALQGEASSLKKELSSLKDKLSALEAKKQQEAFEDIGGIKLYVQHFPEMGRNDLLRLGDNLKVVHPDYLILLLGGKDEHPLVCLAGGKATKLGAGGAVKLVSPLLEARGGGKPEMASGSAKSLQKLAEAKALIKANL